MGISYVEPLGGEFLELYNVTHWIEGFQNSRVRDPYCAYLGTGLRNIEQVSLGSSHMFYFLGSLKQGFSSWQLPSRKGLRSIIAAMCLQQASQYRGEKCHTALRRATEQRNRHMLDAALDHRCDRDLKSTVHRSSVLSLKCASLGETIQLLKILKDHASFCCLLVKCIHLPFKGLPTSFNLVGISECQFGAIYLVSLFDRLKRWWSLCSVTCEPLVFLFYFSFWYQASLFEFTGSTTSFSK